jgi:hypothetical protein
MIRNDEALENLSMAFDSELGLPGDFFTFRMPNGK